jgi:hypothetical protein
MAVKAAMDNYRGHDSHVGVAIDEGHQEPNWVFAQTIAGAWCGEWRQASPEPNSIAIDVKLVDQNDIRPPR